MRTLTLGLDRLPLAARTPLLDRGAAQRARRVTIAIGAGGLLLSLASPLAATAQSRGEQWDDSHMQSNAAHRLDPLPPRPAVRGTNRFEQSASNPTPAPPTTVPETTMKISPHAWTPGGPSGGSASASRSSSGRGASFGGISGGAAPSVSSGISRSSSGRSSSLRSTSSGSTRGTRR